MNTARRLSSLCCNATQKAASIVNNNENTMAVDDGNAEEHRKDSAELIGIIGEKGQGGKWCIAAGTMGEAEITGAGTIDSNACRSLLILPGGALLA